MSFDHEFPEDGQDHAEPAFFETLTTRNVHMTTLKERLYVLKFSRSRLDRYMKQLTWMILYREEEERRVFSLTIQGDEVSLIVDESVLQIFYRPPSTPEEAEQRSRENSLEISPVPWRALQIVVGHGGADLSGLISIMATSLADHKISILNLTLFTTDLIMVREDDLQRAFACLTETVNFYEAKSAETDNADTLSSSPTIKWRDLYRQMGLSLGPSLGVEAKTARCFLLGLPKENISLCAFALLKILFFPDRTGDERFCSISETEEELTLIVEDWALAMFNEGDVTLDPKCWRPLRVSIENHIGWDETGIVAAMCAPLSLANISLLNVSTFSTDFTLVQESQLDEAISVFRRGDIF
eukprot:TRINITY_DN10543_c0_g1_i1.p1 TRINITY_DN10543_c0_g1~~TRINITY_DN10543_c0_g1_i1.p1  ORF type:complete len:356 (-),score=33.57 TRINITY_DN10543_c0_g1_i1:45-1112(-)